MSVIEGKWTCPDEDCLETVVRPGWMSREVWATQLKRIQRKHGKKHATVIAAGLITVAMLSGCTPTTAPAEQSIPAAPQEAPRRPVMSR